MAPDAGGGIPAEPERQPDAPVGDYPVHDPAVAGNEIAIRVRGGTMRYTGI